MSEAQLGIRDALARVVGGQDLTADEMAGVVGQIMDGQTTPAQIGALLTALRMKGETVDEVVGAARAMRSRMTTIDFTADVMVDTCGTGGDGSRSINVSTIAAFVVAAAGVAVPKHGNRALTSQAGAHDVIEALGLDPAPAPALSARCLREAKLAFLFAPAHHAATKHVAGPRKELGFRSVFNMLGPLTNPCGVRMHVNGVFARERVELMARAHGALGSQRALVVHGAGGLDEFAPAGATFVAELADGKVATRELHPADFGLADSDPAGLAGGTPADNARVALDVLRGGGPEAARSAVLMTAGAALYVSGAAPGLRAATEKAASVLAGGGALGVLEILRRIAPPDDARVMILDDILARTRVDVAARKQSRPLVMFERDLAERPAPERRSLKAGLWAAETIGCIAEFKRRSPSAGWINETASLTDTVKAYAAGGASALSVLTDGPFFAGSLDDVVLARAACNLPVLRKDFIVDAYQLYEAVVAGADAVLLIVAALDDDTLVRLLRTAEALGLEVLVESHDADEVTRALAAGAEIIGINNRDLRTFTVDHDLAARLRPTIPDDRLVVAESGIRNAADVARLRAAGVDAMLVGETLMRATDPAAALRALRG